jgi:hypothetical protein
MVVWSFKPPCFTIWMFDERSHSNFTKLLGQYLQFNIANLKIDVQMIAVVMEHAPMVRVDVQPDFLEKIVPAKVMICRY